MWRCSSNPHNLELLKWPPSTSCTNHIPLTSKSNSVCKSPWRPLDQRLVGIPRWRMALHLPFRRLLVCSHPRRAPQKTWHRCPVALPDSEGPAGVPLPPPEKTPMLQPLVPRPKWALTKDKSSSAKQREEWSLRDFGDTDAPSLASWSGVQHYTGYFMTANRVTASNLASECLIFNLLWKGLPWTLGQ